MRTVIIGDLHGDLKGLLAVLEATGAIDDGANRRRETRVIQLGDFIHGGSRQPIRANVHDELCAWAVFDLCDVALIGNHELPHMWPEAGFPHFNGQGPISERLRHLLHKMHKAERLVPALAHDGWLLTHAGTVAGFINECDDAAAAARTLCHHFVRRLERDRPMWIFDGVGYQRGGRGLHGGIFWADWSELIAWSESSPILPQIVGHTPQPRGYARHGNLWCVDAGAALSGRVSAIVQEEAGGEWRAVVVESEAAG